MIVRSLLVAFVLSCPALAARADVEQPAVPPGGGARALAWPRVAPPPGWVQDREASLADGRAAFAPVGEAFVDSPVVMYARAVRKARAPAATTLAGFIDDELAAAARNTPGTRATALPELVDGDGQHLRAWSFQPPDDEGNWERVAFLEEGDWILVFSVSARNEAALKSADAAWSRLVGHYRQHGDAAAVPGAGASDAARR